MEWPKSGCYGKALFEFASLNGLTQLVTNPTRCPHLSSAAQLDLIFINDISCIQSCQVLPQLSDHCPSLLSISYQQTKQPTSSSRFFRKLLPWGRRQLRSFRCTREAATKFSPVYLPLKRRVSRTPLHNAPILDLESELCASQTIGSHPKLTHRL